jgi:hypothetical protein
LDSLPLDSLPLETLIWQVSQHLHPHRAAPHLWVGMILEAKGDLSAAATAYSRSRVVAMPYDWQPTFRLWRVARRLGDAEVARECRDALVRLWGEDQLAWYSTDVHRQHPNPTSQSRIPIPHPNPASQSRIPIPRIPPTPPIPPIPPTSPTSLVALPLMVTLRVDP